MDQYSSLHHHHQNHHHQHNLNNSNNNNNQQKQHNKSKQLQQITPTTVASVTAEHNQHNLAPTTATTPVIMKAAPATAATILDKEIEKNSSMLIDGVTTPTINLINSSNNNNNNNNLNNKEMRSTRASSSSIDSTMSSATYNTNIQNNRKSYPNSSSDVNASFSSSISGSIQDDYHNINQHHHHLNQHQHLHQHSHHHHHGGSSNISSISNNLNTIGISACGSPNCIGERCSLTQADLEEYSRSYYEQNNVFHHQKQSSYAQSEGYHSYVSSSDSSSTPFLDRLRQDSELLLSRSNQWSQELHQQQQSPTNSTTKSLSPTNKDNLLLLNDNNINNNNNNNSIINSNNNNNNIINNSDNNSSESTSSTETLKWLGSMSDVSVASHATNSSALSGSGSSSQLIVHSSRVRTPKRHNSESVLYLNEDQQSITSSSNNNNNTNLNNGNSYSANDDLTSGNLTDDINNKKQYHSIAQPQQPVTNNQTNRERSNRNNHRLFPVSTYTEIPTSQINISSTVSQPQQQQQNATQTIGICNDYQQLKSPNTSSCNINNNNNTNSNTAQQQQPHNWQSVAERINELERQHSNQNINNLNNSNNNISNNNIINNQKYTYLDPSKTHRVSNPTLKQFQKNAVQSYFERQQSTRKDNSKRKNMINNNNNNNSASNNYQNQNNSNNNSNGNTNNSNSSNNIRSQSLQNVSIIKSPSSRSSLPPNYNINNGNNIFNYGLTANSNNSNSNKLQSSYCTPMPQCPVSSSMQSSTPTPISPQSKNMITTNNQINHNTVQSPISPGGNSLQYNQINNNNSNNVKYYQQYSSTNYNKNDMQQQQQQQQQHHKIKRLPSIENELTLVNDTTIVPPPPPPRNRSLMPARRTSSASEYTSLRDQTLQSKQNLSKDLLGPMIMGQIISVDDWVPERPPKNPTLRIPSPELPPPPILIQDNDVSLINQDEPLPPPPPELLRHMRQLSEPDNKISMPGRRNSFAGSSNKKILYRTSTIENLSPQQQQLHQQLQQAPIVPKKPSTIDILNYHQQIQNQQLQQPQRPLSSLSKQMIQTQQAQKVLLNNNFLNNNCKIEQKQQSAGIMNVTGNGRLSDTRLSLRKRSHQSNGQLIQPLLELCPKNILSSTTHQKVAQPQQQQPIQQQQLQHHFKQPQQQQPPPPLKPRMPIFTDLSNKTCAAIGNKLRSNSKASYLPRQSHEKLNTDPDHGIYKLTLTSNEDFINHNDVFNEDLLQTKCNLPDVLPVGVKIHQQHQQQTPRYTPTLQSVTAPILSTTMNPIKSIFNFNINSSSTAKLNQFSNHNNNNNNHNDLQSINGSITTLNGSTTTLNSTTTSPKSLSPTYSIKNSSSSSESISPKYMSQSCYDLKKTQIIDQKYFAMNNTESSSKRSSLSILNNSINENNLYDSNNTDDDNDNHHQFNIASYKNGKNVNDIKIAEKSTIECIQNKNNKILNNNNNNIINNNINNSNMSISNNNFDDNTKNDKLIQKTEIILQVNGTPTPPGSPTTTLSTPSSTPSLTPSSSPILTIETGSQTEDNLNNLNLFNNKCTINTDNYNDNDNDTKPILELNNDNHFKVIKTLMPRKKLQEEIDCEKLSIELVSQLSPSDRLHIILAPKHVKSMSDYVTGLYNPNITPRPVKKDASTLTMEVTSDDENNDNNDDDDDKNLSDDNIELITTNVTTGAFLTKSPKLLSRFNREMQLINGDSCDVTKKKEELVSRLSKKLLILTNEQQIIGEENLANDILGNELIIKCGQKLRPTDASKFRSYIDDVGHITLLLLSLSGRLARVENLLNNSDINNDKKILEVKRDRLLEQLDEAKRLKDDIDRRGIIIIKILEKNLTFDELTDYNYFINMKAKLIVDIKEIQDKIKHGEEQLTALKDTLVHSEC